MQKRVYFEVWGHCVPALDLASYAVRRDDETPIEAVARSIQRTTGLDWCGGPRLDSTACDGSVRIYSGTLGRYLPSVRAYDVTGQVWLSI